MQRVVHIDNKFPIDISRFFLELKKINSETFLKIFCSPIYKDLIEIKLKKGLISLISPYLSGIILIFEKNSQNVFQSLFGSFFVEKCQKMRIVENFVLTGGSFLRHLELTTFLDKNLEIKKNEKVSQIFFNSEFEIQNKLNPRNLNSLTVDGIKFFTFIKFVLIEVDSIFFKENLLLIQWKIRFFNLINNFRKNYSKKYCFIFQKIKKTIYINNKENFYGGLLKRKNFKVWESSLYENCVHQKIHIILNLKSQRKFNKSKLYQEFGSYIYYSNLKMKSSEAETILKNSQKQSIPFCLLSFEYSENKSCLVDKKKMSLSSQLNKFQHWLLTKHEEFGKKFGILNNKLFFHFDFVTPKFIKGVNEEIKISANYIPLKIFLNKFLSINNANILFLIIWTMVSTYLLRTNNQLIKDILYLLNRKSFGNFSKTNSIFFSFKIFKKKEKCRKEIIGQFLENYFEFFIKNEKINFSRIFFSNLFCFNGIFKLKKMKLDLLCLYIEYGLYEKYFRRTRKSIFLSIFFKISHFSSHEKILKLCLRKQLNQKNGKKKSFFFIFLGEIQRNIKFFEVNFLEFPRLKPLIKYLLGISIDNKIKLFHAKKQLSMSITLKPINKQSWLTFGCLSFRNGDLRDCIKSFNKILSEEPDSLYIKNNLNLCFVNMTKPEQINSLILGKILRNSRTSFFILFKIFHLSSSKKGLNIFFIFSSIINLFFLKEQKISIMFKILKGTTLMCLDSLRRKKSFLEKKRKKQSWIFRNLKINLKHFQYKRICFQLNLDLRYFQQKIENATKILYSNNMVEIFLVNKGENFSNFFFETGNRFLREYKKLSF